MSQGTETLCFCLTKICQIHSITILREQRSFVVSEDLWIDERIKRLQMLARRSNSLFFGNNVSSST
jgi:hypothetical protein